MGHPVAPCKCANIFVRSVSFQGNMDGDEGELVRFEKVLFSLCETRITILTYKYLIPPIL